MIIDIRESTWVDNLPQELLKAGGEAVVNWITELSQRVLEGEEIPKDWLHG